MSCCPPRKGLIGLRLSDVPAKCQSKDFPSLVVSAGSQVSGFFVILAMNTLFIRHEPSRRCSAIRPRRRRRLSPFCRYASVVEDCSLALTLS